MKKKLNAMSADNNRLKGNLNQFDGKDKHQRLKIDELGQQMAEALEKLRAADKEKVMKRRMRDLIGSLTLRRRSRGR